MTRMHRILPATLLLCACAQFPELDSTRTPGVATAPYPRLVPFETVLDAPPPRATPEAQAGVASRAESLRARAERLTAPVVDEGTRARMSRGVAEPS